MTNNNGTIVLYSGGRIWGSRLRVSIKRKCNCYRWCAQYNQIVAGGSERVIFSMPHGRGISDSRRKRLNLIWRDEVIIMWHTYIDTHLRSLVVSPTYYCTGPHIRWICWGRLFIELILSTHLSNGPPQPATKGSALRKICFALFNIQIATPRGGPARMYREPPTKFTCLQVPAVGGITPQQPC